jgi:hypothetical protein
MAAGGGRVAAVVLDVRVLAVADYPGVLLSPSAFVVQAVRLADKLALPFRLSPRG